MDDLDRARLTAYAVNLPGELETRRMELLRRLRNDPHNPETPQWTKQEMHDAAQRLMAHALKTGDLVS